MSIATLDADSAISHVVEAMLPRWSDHKLGLLTSIRMDMTDFGYAEDGNTLERDALSVRNTLHFLFVRPSNYTQVYYYRQDTDKPHMQSHPLYADDFLEWNLESDHDSCWRSDGLRTITDVYFEMSSKFDGRLKSGKKLRPIDLSQFNSFDRDPTYVELVTHERVEPAADRYSTEGRKFFIVTKTIERDKLMSIPYGSKDIHDTYRKFEQGWFIKGSEDCQYAIERAKKSPPPEK